MDSLSLDGLLLKNICISCPDISFKTFCMPTKCLKQLKIASTAVEMFENAFFSFLLLNIEHSSLKIPILDEDFSFQQMILQF